MEIAAITIMSGVIMMLLGLLLAMSYLPVHGITKYSELLETVSRLGLGLFISGCIIAGTAIAFTPER